MHRGGLCVILREPPTNEIVQGIPLNNESRHHQDSAERTREFLALYSRTSNWIYSYLLSLVQDRHDADELFQEVSTFLWERFDDFEPGTEFRAWSCRVAYYKVLDWRKQTQRKPALCSEAFLERVSSLQLEESQRLDDRREALDGCLQKLAPRDRDLIERRYSGEQSVETIAADGKRSVHAIYRSLRRIHAELLQCIDGSTKEREAE